MKLQVTRRSRRAAVMLFITVAASACSKPEPEPEPDPADGARRLMAEGRYADAAAEAREVLAAAERDHGAASPEAASVLDVLVEALRRDGRSGDPDTQALAQRVVDLRERVQGPQHPDLVVSLNNLAVVLAQSGRLEESGSALERSLRVARSSLGPKDPQLAWTLSLMGGLHRRLGETEAARARLEEALAIREAALGPEHPDVAVTLNSLALVHADTGDLEGARRLHERALAIREATLGADHPVTAGSLNNLAMILNRQADYAAALPLLERALAIKERTLGADHPSVANTANELALVAWHTGSYEESRELFEKAGEIWRGRFSPDHPKVVLAMTNLAMLHRDLGDYAEARRLYERALAIEESARGGKSESIARLLNNFANLLQTTGDYAGARPLYERVLEAVEPGGELAGISMKNLAEVHRELGDLARSRSLYERALETLRELHGPQHRLVAEAAEGLGDLFRAAGDPERAADRYEQALESLRRSLGDDHPRVAVVLDSLAGVSWQRGEDERARGLLEEALRVREDALGPAHPLVAQSLGGLARVLHGAGDPAGALEHALRAEGVSRDQFRITSAGLAETQALRYLTVRHSGLDVALDLAASGIDAASLRRVWDAVVRSRALVLDGMAERNRAWQTAGDPEVRALAEAYREASARLAHLTLRDPGGVVPARFRDLIRDTRAEAERAERALAERSVAFAQELAREDSGLEGALEVLPDASGLVAFVLYDRPAPPGEVAARGRSTPSYLGFVAAPGEPLAVADLGPASRIDALVAGWRKEAARGALRGDASAAVAAYRAAGAALRRLVWDPLAPRLDGTRRVFIVPDGTLNLVNFAALPSGDAGYLLDDGLRIHYLSGERDLARERAPSRAATGLLALGGVDFDVASAPPAEQRAVFRGTRAGCDAFHDLRFGLLPETLEEVRRVASLWRDAGRRRPVELTGEAATEDAFKTMAPGKDVIHVATHGFFLGEECLPAAPGSRSIAGLVAAPGAARPGPVTENPLLLSGLVLAGANRRAASGPGEEDGILTAQEIAALDLSDVEWAVLSACDTGTGAIRAGEGVLGLRRAFQVAGVATSLMSLWQVEDESTREWMEALYTARLGLGLDTADAVRHASETVLSRRRAAGESTHPFYWAAFVAAGDWR